MAIKRKAIEVANLGTVAAENDTQLEAYFVTEWVPFRQAHSFQNKGFFLLGRTGAGKSAILQYLRLTYKHSPDFVIVELIPDDFFLTLHEHLTELRELADATPHKEFTYKLLWSLVIAGECIRELSKQGKTTELRAPKLAKNLAYSFMKEAGLLDTQQLKMSDKIVRLVGKLKPVLRVKVQAKSVEASAELANEASNERTGVSQIHGLLRDCRHILEEVIPELLGLRHMFVLIDDLDLGWRNDETSNLLLRSLALCLQRFARTAHAIKPLASVRTNIFTQIDLYQTEKIADYIIRCEWDTGVIKKMIQRRLAHAYRLREEAAWDHFFDARISTKYDKKVNTFEYLYARTLGRPRDMLQLTEECLRVAAAAGHSKVTKTDIEKAVADFSQDRARALNEEWRHNYPQLKDVFLLFARRTPEGELKLGYSYTEMWELLAEGHEEFWERNDINWFIALIDVDDTTPLMRTLFDIGIVGIKSSPRVPVRWAHDENPRTITLSMQSRFVVAPVFHSYLETLLPSVF